MKNLSPKLPNRAIPLVTRSGKMSKQLLHALLQLRNPLSTKVSYDGLAGKLYLSINAEDGLEYTLRITKVIVTKPVVALVRKGKSR